MCHLLRPVARFLIGAPTEFVDSQPIDEIIASSTSALG
jgi:hypothetical protein